MRSIFPDCPNFMDTSDLRFKGMHCIIDAHVRQLRNEGVGASVKHTSLIDKDEENLLWVYEVFLVMTPLKACCVLCFITMGKIFA